MNPTQSGSISLEDFRAIVQRAGLELSPEELEHLLPMYQTLVGQLALLHDPALPLPGPADVFVPDWHN